MGPPVCAQEDSLIVTLHDYLINASADFESFLHQMKRTACPNKNLTIFERKIQDYKWKFWNKFWLYCDNKGLKFCLQFVPRKSMI